MFIITIQYSDFTLSDASEDIYPVFLLKLLKIQFQEMYASKRYIILLGLINDNYAKNEKKSSRCQFIYRLINPHEPSHCGGFNYINKIIVSSTGL